MKSSNSFFKFRLIVSAVVVCSFGLACATPGKTQNKETSLAMLTESYADYGKEVSQNPSKLGRIFSLPAGFYAPKDGPLKTSSEANSKKGWLGIGMKKTQQDESTSLDASIEVAMVFPYSPAKEAGVLAGDKIVGLNGNSLSPKSDDLLSDFKESIKSVGAGKQVRLKVLRAGISREITVTLKTQPKAMVKLKPGTQTNLNFWPNSLLHYALKKEKLDGEYRRTAAAIRDRTASIVSFLIKNEDYNPFRLREVNRVMHYPLDLPVVAHEMTEHLHELFNKETKSLPGLIQVGMEALDMEPTDSYLTPREKPVGLGEYIKRLVDAISLSNKMRESALSSLSAEEIDILYKGATGILKEDQDEEQEETKEKTHEQKQQMEKDLLSFFETVLRLDLAHLLTAATHVAHAIDLKSLPGLAGERSALLFEESWTVHKEPNLTTIQTPIGKVLVGGSGNNVYKEDVAIILDMGGDDLYLNRAGGSDREYPFAVVIDFSGDDIYTSTEDFAQGAGILGAGFLIDLEGDDLYSARNYSQGMGFLGAGLLVDIVGRDVYRGDAVNQGAAVLGVGILAEGGGNDDYSATRFSQAFGFVKGYGAIVEVEGADKYFAGGKYPDFRDPEKSYESLSQGFGFGFRPGATSVGTSGGIGILAEGEGNDTYIGDYFAQGSSYWYALGILADRKGHDKYIAGRYSQGAGIHSTAGILIDGEGDDQYLASFGVSQGCGHDYAIGMLLDNGGNDRYIGGVISQGAGNDNGIGILNDNGGDDEYHIKGLGQGRGNFLKDRKLGSFGLHFDTGGGDDYYSPKGKNNRLIFKTEWGILADTN